jgi:Flavin reductase like domain
MIEIMGDSAVACTKSVHPQLHKEPWRVAIEIDGRYPSWKNSIDGPQESSDLTAPTVSGTRPSGVAHLAGVPHHSGNYGPVIEETVASLGCRLHAAHPCGDHHIVIGEVDSVEASPSKHALLRHADTYIRRPSNATTP